MKIIKQYYSEWFAYIAVECDGKYQLINYRVAPPIDLKFTGTPFINNIDESIAQIQEHTRTTNDEVRAAVVEYLGRNHK